MELWQWILISNGETAIFYLLIGSRKQNFASNFKKRQTKNFRGKDLGFTDEDTLKKYVTYAVLELPLKTNEFSIRKAYLHIHKPMEIPPVEIT